jgi:hypothetical protein
MTRILLLPLFLCGCYFRLTTTGPVQGLQDVEADWSGDLRWNGYPAVREDQGVRLVLVAFVNSRSCPLALSVQTVKDLAGAPSSVSLEGARLKAGDEVGVYRVGDSEGKGSPDKLARPLRAGVEIEVPDGGRAFLFVPTGRQLLPRWPAEPGDLLDLTVRVRARGRSVSLPVRFRVFESEHKRTFWECVWLGH